VEKEEWVTPRERERERESEKREELGLSFVSFLVLVSFSESV
jgi:hypothetical protein